jgi:mitochondrial enoyl-[acyl-carrier protein] reductase / trans-2-enoyl-CoA reductase
MSRKVSVACHHEYGTPEDVIRTEEWELPPVGANQVLVEMKAAPINPVDINMLEGKYAIRAPLPSVVGSEGVGVVAQIGDDVTHLQVGQPVIAPSRRGFWCDAYIADADALIPLAPEIPIEQAAMLSINPPTAWWMLTDFVSLEPGDWIIQNAANSAVGRYVIQLARHWGFRTVNVVRRKELIPELEAEGADIVVTDEIPLSKQLRGLIGNAAAKLGLNAVGGDSAHEIAKSLGDHATLVTYGAMGLEPVRAATGILIFKDIRFRGFWVNQWYKRTSTEDIQAMFAQFTDLLNSGQMKVPVEQTYPIVAAKEAIVHARQSRRKGKILFVMN